jgi:predicted  nucleic acid-binding Zn-ribbon protein
MNNRNLKQEKEQLESKNEELNYQIMTINSELMKLKNQINSTKVENIVNNYFYEEDMDFAKYWDEDYYSINPNSCK